MSRFRSPFAATAVGSLTGALAALGVLAPALTSTAAATTAVIGAATSVNGTVLPTAQTNGTVYATAYAAGRLWVGGTFTTARPAGTARGVNETAVTDLAVLDAGTGALSTVRHTLTNTYTSAAPVVYAVTASPDGSTIYVGGDFTSVDGVPQQHLAAFNAATGALRPALGTVGVNGRVLAIAASNATVYAGGTFSRAGSATRSKVAAFTAAGKLQALATTVTGTGTTGQASAVYALNLSADGTHLYLGGTFDQVGPTVSHGLASIDPTTGATQRWNAAVVPPGSYVTTITHDATQVYVAARDNTTSDSSRFEGVKALDPATGTQIWFDNCYGDTFALAVLGGDVYVATHAHDCSAIGGWPESNPRHYGSVYAVTASDGTLTPFLPSMTSSASVPGSQDMPRAFATDGSHLWVGGGFLSVNGVAQQDLVEFGPAGPGARPATPFATARPESTGAVDLTWPTVADADSRTLTYAVYRGSSSTNPLFTTTVDSAFWKARTLMFRDTGEAGGSATRYRVAVTDGQNTVFSVSTATVTATAATTYRSAVIDDGATTYWRLDDAGTTVADASGHGSGGVRSGGVTPGATGATGDGDAAMAFDGATGAVRSVTAVEGPNTFSIEAWFRTTSTTGGKILGLEDAATGAGSDYDRQLYLTDDGRVVFGIYDGSTETVSSASGLNDGIWHQVVGTFGAAGLNLYVDGVPVASLTGTGVPQAFTGYWRVGGGNLGGWPAQPTSSYLAGSIDEVAVYPRELGAAQIARHQSLP